MDTLDLIQAVPLAPKAPGALYVQLGVGVHELIRSGQLAPGTRLPLVREIAAACGVSLVTANRAMRALQDEGLLIAKAGVGTFVAPTQAGCTEVILGTKMSELPLRQVSFFGQLEEGLRDGYGEPERRFVMTLMSAHPFGAAELLRVCEARRSDGVVVHRPAPEFMQMLDDVARHIPIVTLFNAVSGNTAADCVLPDVAPAIRRFVEERRSAGVSGFAVAGFAPPGVRHWTLAIPYDIVRQAFCDTVRRAGFEPVSVPFEERPGNQPLIRAAGRAVPDGTLVLASHPQLGMLLREGNPRLHVVAYTECRETLETARGAVTMLYMGLERVGRAAARLLRARAAGRKSAAQPRIVRLEPEVVHTGSPAPVKKSS